MKISVILIFALFLAPARPTTNSTQPGGCPARQDSTGEIIEDFCKLIELRTKCGENPSQKMDTIQLPPGYIRVDIAQQIGLRSDGVETLKKEPPNGNSDCRTTWDPPSKTLKILCRCDSPPPAKCTKDRETGTVSGPESELRVRIHLFAKKERRNQ